jgi:hypothetical protein
MPSYSNMDNTNTEALKAEEVEKCTSNEASYWL